MTRLHRPATAATSRAPARWLAAVAAGGLVVGAVSLIPSPALAATTRYVNRSSSACTDAGTGTQAAPFCTIGAAVKAAASGDTIMVAAGTYAERVDVPSTKTGLSILGTSATVNASGQLYGFNLAGTSNTRVDGFGIQAASSADVFLNGATGSTVANVTTTGGANGVYVSGGSGNTIDGVTVSGATAVGILVRTSSTNTISASSSHDNGSHGVSIQGGDGNQVVGVTSYSNKKGDRTATGIDVRGFTPATGTPVGANKTVVEDNTTYGNEDTGVELYPGSTNTTVRRNLTYNNGDHGIDVAGSPNTTVVSNTIVGNTNVGLNIESNGAGTVGSTGTTVRDNISVENGTAPVAPGHAGEIRVDTASVPGTTLDRDLVFRKDGGVLFEWNKATYSSLAAMRTATGQEAHGLAGDAKLAADYRPTAGSPAVDAAFAGVADFVPNDHDGTSPVDIASVPNTGTGNPPYADIGAFELSGSAPPPPPPPPSGTLVAALAVRPAVVPVGGSSIVDARGSKPSSGGSVTGYAFSCGNGTAASALSTGVVRCTYPWAGTFTAQVTVTDSNHQTGTATATVVAAPAPHAVLHLKKLRSHHHKLRLRLDGSRSTGSASAPIVAYRFTCGNGKVTSWQQRSYTTCSYRKPGRYVLRLFVKNRYGLVDDAVRILRIRHR